MSAVEGAANGLNPPQAGVSLLDVSVSHEGAKDLKKTDSLIVFRVALQNVKVRFCLGRNNCVFHRKFVSDDQTSLASIPRESSARGQRGC